MNIRRSILLCTVALSALACSHSSGPGPGSAPFGYDLSAYQSQSPVPIVVTSGGRSLFRLGASIGFLEGGRATATFRYRMDSTNEPEHVKVFAGTWTEGPSGLVVTFEGAATQRVTANGKDDLIMTASWSDSGSLLGGVFGFSRVYPE